MKEKPRKVILIVAGEASGDMRAAGLVKAVKKIDPDIHFTGVGGKHMSEAGVRILAGIDWLGVVGIWDVIKHLPLIKRIFDSLLAFARREHIDAAILVDYPGFNLRLARALKGMGIKVIYYISPQVWAWKEGRIKAIQKTVDRMLVLFPFEKDIYAKYGMNADYVGHPLVDEVKVTEPPSSVKAGLGFGPHMPVIGLMPGSRIKEVQRHLPFMLEAAKILLAGDRNRRFIILKAATVPREMLAMAIQKTNAPAVIYDGPAYNGIAAMDAGIVASGTATLETGLLLRPMVILYKTAWLTYWIAKLFVKIPYIGLINVVAGKKIVEEFIQNDATAQNIAMSVEKIFRSPNTYGQMTNDLAQVKSRLGASGASARAAAIVVEELNNLSAPKLP
ncbi:MAG: lipid-A-disaccharide synthase [Candidatus Omnitrophica bacterium]|nr:lipid-A-disaccharide synthase [Candidatus Omnitrophota bacterium]